MSANECAAVEGWYRARTLVGEGKRKREAVWLVGLDPGGADQFGWCVAEASNVLPLVVHQSGVASHARGATKAALAAIGSAHVGAVGIDSPLFWIPNGDRRVDKMFEMRFGSSGRRVLPGQCNT